jgi:hypothetical protein
LLDENGIAIGAVKPKVAGERSESRNIAVDLAIRAELRAPDLTACAGLTRKLIAEYDQSRLCRIYLRSPVGRGRRSFVGAIEVVQNPGERKINRWR